MIHFLHIGKTGGTALRYALADVEEADQHEIELHTHATRLKDVPPGEKVVFFLRNPLDRFFSGFYSRKRKGAPRYNSQWSAEEAIAFNRFATPSEILTAAVSNDPQHRGFAIEALTSIGHIKDSFTYWLDSIEYLQARQPDILFVGFQESLDRDFDTLLGLIKLNEAVKLPQSDKESHRNPHYEKPPLDAAEQAFFDGWFARDIRIFNYCKRMSSVN